MQADRLSTDADDDPTDDYVGALPVGRPSSEPPRTLSAPNLSRPSPGGGRNARHTSITEEALLSASIQTTQHGTRDISPSSDNLGLTLIHACPEPLVDLIFVHGLGGTSRKHGHGNGTPRTSGQHGWVEMRSSANPESSPLAITQISRASIHH